MSNEVSVGNVVDNKYQIIESIGKGGMSNVWLARDTRLGKLWAVKEIKPNVRGARGEALRQAIIDEANFMKRLDHVAIPRVVDILDTGSTIFVVMDYVDGRELSKVLKYQGAPFEQEEVIDWGIQLCDVLSYLHNSSPSIVYRDMKPSNIMLRDDGTVKLIDFGISMERLPGMNNDGKIVGTPGYAPPEQIPSPMPWPHPKSLDPSVVVDGRTDVYSLGATLYTLVTGHVPKRIKDDDGHDQVSFDMRPIRSWNPQLSEGLDLIILRATQKDPAQRYQTIEEMRYDLAHYKELTQEWRAAQQRKVDQFRHFVIATGATLLSAILCLVLSFVFRSSSYQGYLHEASEASREAAKGEASDAELLYTQAIELSPTSIEPYSKLIEVYESDYQFTDDEDARWRKAYAKSRGMENDSGYAQFCFDVGACYLSYYGIDNSGGSVGNAAIASINAAAPWFQRTLDACGTAEDHNGQVIDDTDLRAAGVYRVISQFYEKVTRAGKEGKGATEEYREFWDALTSALKNENEASDTQKSTEGVRIRLCQIGTEALASTTYLAGFARAGVTEAEARSLMGAIQTCMNGLSTFATVQEYEEVYGPVLKEIEAGLQTSDTNIVNTYSNPVVAMGRGGSQQDGQGEVGEQ